MTTFFRKHVQSSGLLAQRLLTEEKNREEALQTATEIHVKALEKGGWSKKDAVIWSANAASLGLAWLECGFPVLEVGHRLAASLISTQVSGPILSGVDSPWRCFVVSVQAGVVSDRAADCLILRARGGGFHTYTSDGRWLDIGLQPSIEDLAEKLEAPQRASTEEAEIVRLSNCMNRLVIGAHLELIGMSTDRVKQKNSKAVYNARSKDMPKCWFFTLTRQVVVDCRSEVRDYVRGGGSPHTVQSLVRGHYRSQPFGPAGLLRKVVHVEPYWRGPEDAPIALRSHVLERA